MKHLDIKVTVWNRIHFEEDADLTQIIHLIETNGIAFVSGCTLEDCQQETLLDTEQVLSVADNEHCSTIELFDNGNIVWENGK